MSKPVTLLEVEERPVEWLCQSGASAAPVPLIPRGMLTVVAGKPDQGKGLFTTWLAAYVSKHGGRVLFSAHEDDQGRMTRPRMRAAGAKLDNVYGWRFQLPTHINELAAYVEKNKIDLIVMDPFNSHLVGVSRNNDSVRQVLKPLTEDVAEKYNCAIVIVDHALKRIPQSAHPLTAIGGSSSGLAAAARMAFILGVNPDNGDQRVLAPVKHNICERPKPLAYEVDIEELTIAGKQKDMPFLIPRGEIEMDAMRLLQVIKDGSGGNGGRPPAARAKAAEWLTEYLIDRGQPVKAGDIIEDAKQFGITSKTLKRAAEDMEIVKNPPTGGKGCTWDLPQEVKDLFAEAREGQDVDS